MTLEERSQPQKDWYRNLCEWFESHLADMPDLKRKEEMAETYRRFKEKYNYLEK